LFFRATSFFDGRDYTVKNIANRFEAGDIFYIEFVLLLLDRHQQSVQTVGVGEGVRVGVGVLVGGTTVLVGVLVLVGVSVLVAVLVGV